MHRKEERGCIGKRKDILSSLFSPLFSLLAIRPYDFPQQPTTNKQQTTNNKQQTTTNNQQSLQNTRPNLVNCQ